jgi:vacuolar protein-sorting-associated protein 4
MDGVGNGTDGILVLGATNIPWGLDDALLRRMERRVYIPLPDKAGRAHMFKLHIGDTPHCLTSQDFDTLASMSDGYSGSDLKTVCRDAIMEPVRLSTQATHFKKVCENGKEMFTPCSPGDAAAQEMDLMLIESETLLLPAMTLAHFESALEKSKPSVGKDSLEKFLKFTREKGQEGQ